MSLRSLVLPPHPFFSGTASTRGNLKCVRHNMQIYARKPDDYGDHYRQGKLVDENMMVLRERIQEMKLAEQNFEPPADWMDWEKRYYEDYDSDICKALGLLQTLLMSSRPSFVLGAMAVVALSIPTSMAAVLCQLMEIANNMG